MGVAPDGGVGVRHRSPVYVNVRFDADRGRVAVRNVAEYRRPGEGVNTRFGFVMK